jgi:MFS family permease
MYVAESTRAVRATREAEPGARGARVGRIVLLLGLTSLLTDVSAEMVATILPVYVVFALGATPLQFGILDGLYQGASAFVRLFSGVLADRRGRHKQVAVAGYGLSALSKLGLILAGGTVPGLAALLFVDRTGKGIRTAPRDAMISLSSRTQDLGRAFGVHRMMDTAGALLGPLVAVGLLALAPRRYDVVFVVSLAFALVGLAVLIFFVQPAKRREQPEPKPGPELEPGPVALPPERVSLRDALRLLREPRFRMLAVVGGVLALATISDGFIYLGLQRNLDFSPTLLPLLYVGTACAYMVLAVPFGVLADRIGRWPVFIFGYSLLTVVYAALLLEGLGTVALVGFLLLFGAYYAATDGASRRWRAPCCLSTCGPVDWRCSSP